MKSSTHFTKHTLEFIRKASRQKKANWLDRNKAEFEAHVRFPLQNLAANLAKQLRSLAPDYHFPLKGLGRLKRSTIRAQEYGSMYKSHVSFTITRPSKSRFDHNPSIFFMLNSEDDEGDEVLLAGGLYLPSSRQLKSIREKISQNPEPFTKLFRSSAFAARFPGGFSMERTATRPPRGFDPNHSHIHWLKLQGYFVWRSYTKKEFTSVDFPALVAKDSKQILRLNELLERAIANDWPEKQAKKIKSRKILESLDSIGENLSVLPTPDF